MHASLAALATLLLHAPLWFVAHRIARRTALLGTPGNPLETFLIAWFLWRVEALALGACGALHGGAVLAAHLALALLVVGIDRRWPCAPTDPAGQVAGMPLPSIPAPSSIITGAWWGLAAALALHRTAFLPDPYDALTYHLMLPARWLVTGTLSLVPTSFGDIAPTYTPEAVEVFFLGLMLPGGGDLLARVGQVPFLVAMAALVAELVRRAGRGPTWLPALAGTSALLLPELLEQGSSAMVDTAAAVALVAACLAGTRLGPASGPLALVVAGGLAGLFLGSRFTGPVFLPAVLLCGAWALGTRWRAWGWWVAGLALAGAYPFARNLVLTGNPLYPLALAVGPWELPGLFTRAATLASPLHIPEAGQFAVLARHGFQLAGLALLVLGLLSPWWRDRRLRWAPAVALWILLAHWVLVPYTANLRFLFPAWALLVAAASGWAAGRSGSTSRLGSGLLIVLATALAIETLRALPAWLGVPDQRLLIGAGLPACALLGACGAWILRESPPRVRRAAPALALALLVAGLGMLDGFRTRTQDAVWQRDRGLRYARHAPAWKAIAQLPAGARIAYTGLNLPYPLLGPEHRHEVLTLPLDGSPPGRLPHEHAQRIDPQRPPAVDTVVILPERWRVDRAAWSAALERESIDVIAIYLHPAHLPPIEHRWVEQEPSRFRRWPESERDARAEGLRLYRIER